jgi:hypothetical protein
VKLIDRYLGLFKVIEVIGAHRQAYRLKLLLLYKIHDIFYVSLLEPWHPRAGAVIKYNPIKINGEEEFKIELILAHREEKKGREYLVY